MLTPKITHNKPQCKKADTMLPTLHAEQCRHRGRDILLGSGYEPQRHLSALAQRADLDCMCRLAAMWQGCVAGLGRRPHTTISPLNTLQRMLGSRALTQTACAGQRPCGRAV